MTLQSNHPEIPAPHEDNRSILIGDHVVRIEHPEPDIVLSPEEAARQNDELERATLLEGRMNYDEISLARAAQLLGDHVSTYPSGAICLALIDEAKAGRLRVYGEWHRKTDRHKRPQPTTILLDRDALREWLAQHGTDEMRNSAGATWCRYAR